MTDDLIGTAEVATRLNVSVATVNRWQDDSQKATTPPLLPAIELPGPKRTAARLYRLSDVQAIWDRVIGPALARGACPACTGYARQVWHNSDPCPNEPVEAAS